jgi:AcrR family transcriptional regulator
LGATKGSFYWHFANRDALVAAALQLWETRRTEAVITLMDAEPDPLQRLRRLFAGAVGAGTRDRVEVSLLAAADDPLVGPALRRVTARRIDYLSRSFAELGLPAPQARVRALIAFSAYLGNTQLAHVAPESLPEGADQRRAYLDRTVDLLTADVTPGGG